MESKNDQSKEWSSMQRGTPHKPSWQARAAAVTERASFSMPSACMRAKSLQSCPTFCYSMDSSLPGSSVHGDSPGGSDSKESACNAGDAGSIPGSGISPGEGKWQPTPVFLPGKSHGQRRLVGYSPWGRRELDTTEQLN